MLVEAINETKEANIPEITRDDIVIPAVLMRMAPGYYEDTVFSRPADPSPNEKRLILLITEFNKAVDDENAGRLTTTQVGIIPASIERPPADFEQVNPKEAVAAAAAGQWQRYDIDFLVAGPQVNPKGVRWGAIASDLLRRSRLAITDRGTQQSDFRGNGRV